MHSVFTTLVLSALLVSRAVGDMVTTEWCPAHAYSQVRVRRFPVDGNATFLWLADCSLSAGLNDSLLVGLPNIRDIELTNNGIAHINWAPLERVPKLRELMLAVNILRELPIFPKRSCPSLTVLWLNYNKLTGINEAETFSACEQLKTLYLHGNDLKYIHPNAFSALTELETLDIHQNKIEFIPDQMFARNTKLRDLQLYDNKLTYLPPGFVNILKDAGGGLERFNFYHNPWHCACLLELLADVKRAGVQFHMKDPVCVYGGAGPCYRPGHLLSPPSHVAGGGR